jgi:hypothetical protein
MLDTAVRVIYLDNPDAQAGAQDLLVRLRNEAKLPRVFYCRTPRAIVLRGTVGEVAAGEKIVAEINKPAL